VLVDTNILYYAFQLGEPIKHPVASNLIATLNDTGEGCISTQVLLEFSSVVLRKSSDRYSEIASVFAMVDSWRVHQPTPNDILAAVERSRRYQLSLWDAMIVTSAVTLGCSVLYSEDLNHGQVIDGVRIVNPFLEQSPSTT